MRFASLIAFCAYFGALAAVCAQESVVEITLGKNRLEIVESASECAVATPFARACVAKSDVRAVTTDSDSLTLDLTNGKSFVFTALGDFIAVDYIQTGEALLASEEPLTWTLTCFAEDRLNALKAFGTAGIRPIDGHNGSYAFLAAVDPETRLGVVSGWITSEQAGGVVRSGKDSNAAPTLTPRLDYGAFQTRGRVMRERFVMGRFDDCRLGLEAYADAIADHYGIETRDDALVGYCTWYAEKHGASCDENAIKELTQALVDDFGEYGMQFVQIDSTWQAGDTKNGEKKNFTRSDPNGGYPFGMKPIAEYLESKGLKAGLWVAPFAGSSDDPYFDDKRDLFVRSAVTRESEDSMDFAQRENEPYETFWGGTPLDMSNPKARDYLRAEIDRITKDWNFKYIKADALWTGAALRILYVNDEYREDDMGKQIFFDPTRTNIENYRAGLHTLRESSNGAFIMGCVASQNMRTLASSYGMLDAMRVGPDNSAEWDGMKTGYLRASNRYFYNARVWRNDPDPVYARIWIPIDRARVSASWAALTGQLFALADWAPDYDAERVDLIRRCIPNHGQARNVRPVDLFDEDLPKAWTLTCGERCVLGLFNWSQNEAEEFSYTPEKLGLPTVDEQGRAIEKYVAFDFWGNELVEPFDTLQTTVKQESCKILSIRPIVDDRPILLSTSRHITQGVTDVKREEWNAEKGVLTFDVDVPRGLAYEARVYDPTTKRLARWTAPEDVVGMTTVLYDAASGAFRVVR